MVFDGHKSAGVVACLIVGVLLVAAPARADFQISVFNGYNYNVDTDFTVKQPGGTNFTIHDVESDSESFNFTGGPPYYGGRITYWFDSNPKFGVALDYAHTKVKPDLGQTVNFSGTGVTPGDATINSEIEELEFTDGLNLLTLNALYRFTPHGQFAPYVGAGVGLSIPHVEFRRTGSTDRTFDYQIAGVAAQALAGVEYRWTDTISSFAEYRFSYADVDGDLDGGGSLETEIYQHHLTFGLSYRFDTGGRFK